jgi:hypothetical protein
MEPAYAIRDLNTCLALGLTSGEKSDLIQYLLSLTFGPAPQRH